MKTPGNWHYCGGAVYARRGDDGYGENRLALMDRENPETSPAERDANARLMAASPELLAAVETAERLADRLEGTDYLRTGEADEFRAALARAKAYA